MPAGCAVGGPDRPRAADFRLARIGAAAALIGVLVAILVIDAASTEYQVDPIVITALLGTLGTLLGIEGLASLRQSSSTTATTVRQETSDESAYQKPPPEEGAP
jgi:hypothetical protein